MDPLIVLFGLGVGILIGLTGIGGGSLMTPLLVLVIGTSPLVAIGTDIAYGAVTKTLGGWRHLRHGTVDLGLSKWLAFGSVPGSIAGVVLVDRLHEQHGSGFDSVLLGCVAGALLIVALTILCRTLFMPRLAERERPAFELSRRSRSGAMALGLFLGMIVGLTSVGSGALIGLALILVFRMAPHRVVGTDVFHAAILLWSAGLAHLIAGNVDFVLMANILIGSLPGVWLGTSWSTKIPEAGLRPALGCVLLASALGVMSKAGVDVPIAMLLGLPAAVGVLAAWLHRSRGRRASMVPMLPQNDACRDPAR